MHMTGSFVPQPPATEEAIRISGVELASLREAVVPSVGWLVTMKALHVDGVSFLVSVVSNHTCTALSARQHQWKQGRIIL